MLKSSTNVLETSAGVVLDAALQSDGCRSDASGDDCERTPATANTETMAGVSAAAAAPEMVTTSAVAQSSQVSPVVDTHSNAGTNFERGHQVTPAVKRIFLSLTRNWGLRKF